MHAAGLAAFAARLTHKTGIYTYEQRRKPARPQKFPAAIERIFRANKPVWKLWQAQPPGYQREVIHWVTSAKQAETRDRRLAQLIAITAKGGRIGGK